MKRISLSLPGFLLISVLLYAPMVHAGNEPEFVIEDGWDLNKVELYDLESIIDGDPWASLEPPTRVDMTGGRVGNCDWNSGMYTYESTTFNVSGGTIDYLRTYDSSTVNFSGVVSNNECGSGPSILTYDSSTINVFKGARIIGTSFHMLELYDSSKLNVYGGDVYLYVLAHNSSIVNIYDGEISVALYPYDYSTINIYGGFIGYYHENVPVPETATVNIYGYDFNYDPQASWEYYEDPCDGFWITKLTGFGAGGTEITYWAIPDPAAHSNINLIPDFVLARGVDLADFAVFASAWKTQDGDAQWNHICDISDPNDNIVDERDLAVLTKYWLAGK